MPSFWAIAWFWCRSTGVPTLMERSISVPFWPSNRIFFLIGLKSIIWELELLRVIISYYHHLDSNEYLILSYVWINYNYLYFHNIGIIIICNIIFYIIYKNVACKLQTPGVWRNETNPTKSFAEWTLGANRRAGGETL